MDVVFVHVPADLRFPVNDWCLGYRYLVAALRDAGFSAGIVYPRRAGRAPGRSVADTLVADVLAAHPAVVGLTTYDPQLSATLAFVRRLRQAGLRAHVTLGGMCASAIPAAILDACRDIDSVVVGEGEQAIVELTEFIFRGGGSVPAGVWARNDRDVVVGIPRPFMVSLEDLPTPSLDDLCTLGADSPLHNVAGCAPVIASRGCYGRCTFCCVQRFYRATPGRPWRGCSPARVADEVATVTRLTRFERVTFVDENFMGPGRSGRRHAIEVAEQIRDRAPGIQFNFACRPNDVDRETFRILKRAGLAGVTLGIESMWPDTLNLFGKHTTPAINQSALNVLGELMLNVEITFIFFQPFSTLDEIRTNLAFVEQVARSPRVYFSNGHPFTSFIPLAGTGLTSRFAKLGLVHQELAGGTADYVDPRAALVARHLLAVPIDDLLQLALALPQGGSERLIEIQRTLRDHHWYLAMRRLPDLAAELCDAIEANGPSRQSEVDAVTAAIDAETARIRRLIEQFASHMPEMPTPPPDVGRLATPGRW